MKGAKIEYDLLKESGDLLEMFPDFTGLWDKDKKQFSLTYESNQKDISMLDVEFDEL